MKTIKILLFVIAFILAFGMFWLMQKPYESLSSVAVSNDYNSTSSGSSVAFAGLSQATLKSGQGTLGSVIITAALTQSMTFYDATTTNVNLRVGATSTLKVLGHFPPSMAAGVYTFDTFFTKGLLMDSGRLLTANGSTTVTYR